MRTLYPEIEPFQQGYLEVDSNHSIYFEQSGNPSGFPVLFIHGGPGGGCSPEHRRFFNPQHYRIICFDQRGCGHSKPHGSLIDNTTAHLIADMEQLRVELGIERWLLFGGSWGSTLSLAYAQNHPDRVDGMVLRGIFLCRSEDIHWFYQEGASRLFPDAWRDFIKPIPKQERSDLVSAYHRLLTGSDELLRMGAAKAWSIWEARCSTLDPSPHLVEHFGDPHVALAMARIECHYFNNGSYLAERPLLEHCDSIQQIPTWIVHGRYDVVCPVDQALALHDRLPESELSIIRDAGHSAFEPGITDQLIRITDRYVEQLGS